jgi:hypothetical protein
MRSHLLIRSFTPCGAQERRFFSCWGNPRSSFGRFDLSVVLPDLTHGRVRHGKTPNEAEIRLGFIASAGTVAYAFGCRTALVAVVLTAHQKGRGRCAVDGARRLGRSNKINGMRRLSQGSVPGGKGLERR